jgi:hypothetical protein
VTNKIHTIKSNVLFHPIGTWKIFDMVLISGFTQESFDFDSFVSPIVQMVNYCKLLLNIAVWIMNIDPLKTKVLDRFSRKDIALFDLFISKKKYLFLAENYKRFTKIRTIYLE